MSSPPPPRLLLFDGSNLFVRCFHGTPRGHSAASGTPTGAVEAFMAQLLAYYKLVRPTHWMVAWDTPRANSWRRARYPAYKGTRGETDPELAVQWPLVMEAAELLAVPTVLCDGFEADDVIASAVRWAADAGWEQVTVVSSDKDMLQLLDVHPALELRSPAHGSEPRTRAALTEKYGAVGMAFRDIQAIQGDASDNVPGVPGVGAVGAKKVVQEIGLDRLLRGEVRVPKAGPAARVLAHRAELLLSRELVTLRQDAPLPEDFAAHTRCRRASDDGRAAYRALLAR